MIGMMMTGGMMVWDADSVGACECLCGLMCQMAKSKGREAGGAKKKKGDAVATGQEAMSVKELIER